MTTKVRSIMQIVLYKMVLIFESVDEIL